MKSLILGGLWLTLAPVFSKEPESQRVGVFARQTGITLQQAMLMALEQNLEIETQRNILENTRLAVKAARGVFDPNLRWNPSLESRNTPTSSILMGSGGRLSERFFTQNVYFQQKTPWRGLSFRLDFENNRQTSSNPFSSLNPYYNSRLLVGINQPLWRNRQLDRERLEIRVRSKQTEMSREELELKVTDIVSRVEQAYWDLVAARQEVVVQKDHVDWAEEQLARNQRMILQGVLARVEIAASEAELERRRDNWYAGLEALTRAENLLKTMLSSERSKPIWDEELIPFEETPATPPEGQFPDMVKMALEKRLELRLNRLRDESNQLQKKFAAEQTKPQVNLTGAYINSGLAGTLQSKGNFFSSSSALQLERLNQLSMLAGLPPLPPTSTGSLPPSLIGGFGGALANVFSGHFQTFQIGLAIDLTVRNRTAEASLAQTMVAEKNLKVEKSRLEQEIDAQVRNALQSLHSARQRISASEAGEKAAKEKLESEIRLFQNNESTNFMVLTRQNEYADARRRTLQAKLDYHKAIARLEQATGRTLEAHQITLP